MAEFTIQSVEQILADNGITDEDTVAELREIWSLTYRANRNWQKTYDMASIPGWIEATFGTGGSGDGTEAVEDTASGGGESASGGGESVSGSTQSVAYAYSGTEPPAAAVPQYYTSGDTVVFYDESGGVEASWPADHLVDEVTYAVLEFGKRLQSAALKGITDSTASGDGLSTGSGGGTIIDTTASGDGIGVSGDSTTTTETTTEEVSENG